MAIEVRRMSWWDTLRLQLFVTVPGFLWGLVAPNRLFASLLCRVDAGRATLRFLGELRERYRCDHLWTWFPLGRTALVRTLLVLDADSIDAVLASGDASADPALKKLALSRFVPEALVISSGEEWQDRRRFNEEALDLGRPHRDRDAFRRIVARESERLIAGQSGELRWTDFEGLAERVSQQVILGEGQVRPELTGQLARMVRRSNLFLRDRRSFPAFYERIERDLAQPATTHCLIASRGGSAATQVPAQVGFWFFVLKDIVELHVARTLALIAAHPEAQERVRLEIRDAGELTAGAIDELTYLDACIREQLRLWTPVPILLRRAVRRFALRGETIEAGQQLLIHAGCYHRDARVFGGRADTFSPDPRPGPAVYSFSAHRQSCAGQTLAMFLLKSALASLLARCRFELAGPPVEPARIPCLYDHFELRLRFHGDGS